MTNLNTIPAEESTLLNKPKASAQDLKLKGLVGAANASTKAKKKLQMVPSHCAGKSGKCNPPNGDKVVGDDSWSQIEWTRV